MIITLNPVVSTKLANIEKLQKLIFIRKRKSKDIEGQILEELEEEDNELFTEEKVIKLEGNKVTRFKNLIKALRKNYETKTLFLECFGDHVEWFSFFIHRKDPK